MCFSLLWRTMYVFDLLRNGYVVANTLKASLRIYLFITWRKKWNNRIVLGVFFL